MTQAARPGDVLADRYKLVDLLSESGNGRFWRAHDDVLDRHVALHCIAEDDERAAGLTEAARLSATVLDRRLLRVLDADHGDGMSYVVNEWGTGTSLDILIGTEGPMPPRKAAWVVSEVAASIAVAHEGRVAHGRLVPETVLLDDTGSVRIIGCCVDAALRGLPAGRISQDVNDLGGLLYFALTGRWAGSSVSNVRPAPRSGGRWLRPRQVRAGIPRILDGICDVVLNPYAAPPAGGAHNLLTAAGLAEALREYVGDPVGLAEASPLNGVRGAGALAVPGPRPARDPDATRTIPPAGPAAADPADDTPAEPLDAVDTPEQTPTVAPEASAEDPTLAAPTVPPGVVTPPTASEPPVDPVAPGAAENAAPAGSDRAPDPVDQPTEAGLPIFDDQDDEVSWFSARNDPPPPPPPLEDPPERPLFAPEPTDGGPARRPRPGSAATGQREYWPWDAATGAGTGSGVIPVTEDDDDDDNGVPGRSWFRLGAIVGASLLLVLAVIVAFNLGRGKTPLGTEPEPESPSTSAGQSPRPLQAIEVAGVRDFDPQGDPPEENPDVAPLAVDGDPATAWNTQTYFDQFGPGGLKTGIGLVVDLGESQEVGQVDLTTLGSPMDVSYYVTEDDPTAVAGLRPVASGTVEDDSLRTTFDEPATGRYLIVWITSLPQVGSDFRAEIAEVEVKG
ncbi:hypothetical protein [Nocardioides sp. GXQ0305]|uniref:protein kinase family protein n=1 Tax=Nocardioides sp. GXQ0305 TaxID=3423912 RepID=UPI003D7D7E26